MKEIKENLSLEIEKIMQSGALCRYFEKDQVGHCDIFEDEFTKYVMFPNGEVHTLILSQFANCFTLALKTLKIEKDDEVLICVHSHVSVALAVAGVGATPIYVDMDKNLAMSVESLHSKITEKTKAIIATHPDGMSCNIDEISKLASDRGIYLIEDVTQALGGTFNNRALGTYGIFGCFSLNMHQSPTNSLNEGGVLICNDRSKYLDAVYMHDPLSLVHKISESEKSEFNIEQGNCMRANELTGLQARYNLKNLPKRISKLKEIKRKILNGAIINGACPEKIHLGHDAEGDCSTHLYVSCDTSTSLTSLTKELNSLYVFAAPVSMKHLSFPWQCEDLLRISNSKLEHLSAISYSASMARIVIDENWTEEIQQKVSKVIGENTSL